MLKYLFLFAFALASNSSYAQKMNVLDYFKAFSSNAKSPNNQLYKAAKELSITKNDIADEYTVAYYANQKFKSIITHTPKNNYLTFKKGFFEGWNGGECYPTFKVYTKADGQQILGVTEDSYTHHSYKSKYRLYAPTLDYSDCPNYDEEKNLLRRNRQLTTEERVQKTADLDKMAETYVRKNDPYHQWNQRPKPIKFWTYEAGIWTEVTEQVMTVFFSLEEMISKTTATLDAGMTLSEHMKEHINFFFYPLYRIEAEKDEITVWVDEVRLRLFTTEIEEFANPADNISSRKVGLTKNLYNFSENTTYKSYTLVWDAKAGQFVRKK